MAATPLPADMFSVIEDSFALTAQLMVKTIQIQNLVTAVENYASATTTASAFLMTKDQLKVEHFIEESDKVGLNMWKAVTLMKASGSVMSVKGMKTKPKNLDKDRFFKKSPPPSKTAPVLILIWLSNVVNFIQKT